jgi:hypothetical protein
MKIEKVSADEITLVVPTDEIRYLYNAICIALEELPPSHFKARTQETAEYAAAIRDQFADVIAKVGALR